MIVKSLVFCSAPPALQQHVIFTRRVEIRLHVLISLSLSASLCSAVQQMKSKRVIYRDKTLTQTVQLLLLETATTV